ncbi:MAG: ferredoxin [Candidatus Dormiibacterota bacterium]
MTAEYLRIDPTACAGHRLCAELLPEMVRMDDWGYPIIDVGPIPPGLRQHAQRAVSFCPTLALTLRSDPATGRPAPTSLARQPAEFGQGSAPPARGRRSEPQ